MTLALRCAQVMIEELRGEGEGDEEIQQRMSPNTIEVQRSVDKVDEQDPMMQLPSIPGGSTHTLHTQSR